MANLANAPFIGNVSVAPTAAQLQLMKDYDKGLGSVGRDRFSQFPASSFPWFMFVGSTVNNATVPSVINKVPHPMRVWAVDAAVESAAGATATIDLHTDPAGGTTFATALPSAIDVKTTAGTAVRSAVLDTKCDLPYNTSVKLVAIGGGAGAVVGSQAILWSQRL